MQETGVLGQWGYPYQGSLSKWLPSQMLMKSNRREMTLCKVSLLAQPCYLKMLPVPENCRNLFLVSLLAFLGMWCQHQQDSHA